jgi:hypothetical protein
MWLAGATADWHEVCNKTIQEPSPAEQRDPAAKETMNQNKFYSEHLI